MAKTKGGRKTTKTKSNDNNGRFYRRKQKDKEDEEVQVVQVKDFEDEEDDCDDDKSDDGDEIENKETRKLVTQQNRKKKKSGGFQSMGLSNPVYRGIMKKGYKIPTPIQRKAMPVIMDGKDVVAMARTGSGKTAAFLIPMFEKLQSHSAKTGARALIMSPTRELALQTLKFIKELGRFTGIKAAVILGGDSFEGQFAAIHRNPDIIVATPGRFLHVIMEMDFKLSSVEYIVFDEADRLFEMGFSEQLHEIIHKLPDSRQTLLFSATLPRILVDFAKAGLTDPALIRLDVDSKISDQLKMAFFYCRADDKPAILLHLLQNVISQNEQTLIFVATKHHVEYLKELLSQSGICCSYVYSSLDQTARTINVSKFQHKKTMVMVVTDVAARGIDIPMLDNVINFHFPAKSKLFIHRVGRVARAGRSGTAYSLVAMDEVAHMLDLHLFLGRPLKVATKDSKNDDSEGLLGRVPQRIVDEEEDFLRTAHDQSHDLFSLQGVCTNAYKQYIRSRTNPSSESVKRAKELVTSTIAVHPILGSTDDESTVSQAQLLDSVRNFKSRQTIFEVCPTAKSSAHKVMRSKRERHGEVIEKAKQRKLEHETTESWKTSSETADDGVNDNDVDMQGVFTTVIDPGNKNRGKSGSSSNFRDENYIPHRSSDHYAEKGLGMGLSTFEKVAAGSVIEINGDDDLGLRKNKHVKKWDRKRKRFIGADEEKKKKIKTESGARIPATYKKDIYKTWIKKNRMDAPGTTRDMGDDEGVGKRGKKGKFNKKGAHKGGKTFPSAKNELKSKDQILKARKAKERLMQKQKMGKDRNRKKKMMQGR
ncbi:ATP-dependent RNA helicase DDX54-like [Actinia tenebrosa]|uniref:ATP-dependent RNA helicase DDX54 n=1 Tax=Actinia tenebrosa TaxID=6105 RepID=A0A6P8HVD7_ACTTE|nr:ATP-dependent RNA helicase DDX54-like [Actinia tenebrosa]